MAEQEHGRVVDALNAMFRILNDHEMTFPAGEEWSTECQEAIEGLRIANKCRALIAHDRVLTTPSNLCHTGSY